MTAERFLRELTWPLTELVVLLAIIAFSLLATFASAAGSLSIWVGIWLGIMLMPGLFRYLLMLLEAKAYGHTTPVANIELFSFISNLWSLTWLVICAVTIWGGILLAAYISLLVAQVFALLLFAMLPGSLAVLAITRSPFASLNPRTVSRMIAVSGWQYWLVPVAVGIAFVIAGQLVTSGAPGWLVTVSRFYCLFLLFTLTGGVLHANGVRFSLSFDGSTRDDDDMESPPVTDERTRLRTRVLTHAYGFFSRDNRAGALAHIESALRDDEDVDGAWQWYFNEMLNWESKDGALMLAQSRLTRLLDEKRDVEAVKLISRCLLENSRFRPLPKDRDAAMEAAERLHRDDLAKALE